MGQILYRSFVFLYPVVARLLAFFQPKAKAWVKGRQNIWATIENGMQDLQGPVIWMHCASTGEYEQGRPLLHALHLAHPQHAIVLSFFSPSGFSLYQHDPLANRVFYLPMDHPLAAQKWLALVHPQLAIFVKYEFWFYYLQALKKAQVPALLVSGIFRPDQLFFAWYGGFFRRILASFSHLFVQDQNSADLLQQAGIQQCTIAGDTRFERVLEIAQNWQHIPGLAEFCQDQRVWVMGSTWSKDDQSELVKYMTNTYPSLRFVVAPHELSPERIRECLAVYPDPILYSNYLALSEKERQQNPNRSLVVDKMGLLSRLYKYGEMAFVGGGYDKEGVHNTLEAAAFGKPLCFGPIYEKYKEAVDLVALGAAKTDFHGNPLTTQIDALWNNAQLRHEMGKKALDYVQQGAGATEKIMAHVHENLLLTK
ncbi:MAG: 3-deoxy-D-manno-octulosonic acid transferase [Sphingobacteriia bacterium]|nr:MAG: 3-deoxy-D-manno-octulosonic acid transferase [Sphingobacteriia bacterium]